MIIRILIFSVAFLEVLSADPKQSVSGRPNVVIILADDLGYGDVRANNPVSKIPTPNMDILASEGIQFTDAHSPSAVCTPTRYGLLTGRYSWRTSLKSGVLMGYSPALIEPNRRTIANVFEDAGYSTACIGKWHLGMNMPKLKDSKGIDWSGRIGGGPTSLGFGYYFGISASLDMPPYTWIENERFVAAATDVQLGQGFPAYMRRGGIATGFAPREGLDTIVRKGSEWIVSQAVTGKPFFLYLPLTAPHKPVMPAERFVGKSKLGPYGDFIMAVDDAVGQILGALDRSGVADNTLLVLTSDNGSFMANIDSLTDGKASPVPDHVGNVALQGYLPEHHQANGIFRGSKTDIWEGGHRVPFLLRWPSKAPGGRICRTPICLTDLFATSVELVGQKLSKESGEDSHSMLPLFSGDPLTVPRPAIVHHSAKGVFAIRHGRWKLILCSGSGGRGIPKGSPFDGGIQLYDMEKDPSETINLAAKHPEVVDKYTKLLERFRSSDRSRSEALKSS